METKKFYKYGEIRKDPKTVYFGWVPCDPITSGKLVLATSEDFKEWDNLATLSDYGTFFSRFTKTSPSQFYQKWKDSPKEYSLYWYNHMPSSEVGSHLFYLKLAGLICNEETFDHTFSKGCVKYQVINVSDASKGHSTGN